MKREKTEQERRSEAIVHWLDTHECFNVGTLCRVMAYDPSNFRKMRMMKFFPIHILPQIEEQLKRYGFTLVN